MPNESLAPSGQDDRIELDKLRCEVRAIARSGADLNTHDRLVLHKAADVIFDLEKTLASLRTEGEGEPVAWALEYDGELGRMTYSSEELAAEAAEAAIAAESAFVIVCVPLYLRTQPASSGGLEEALKIIAKHRQQVERSTLVNEHVSGYAVDVLDDIARDLRTALRSQP